MVELASNDGYLLQHLVAAGIPCLGIDPAANVANAAEERGVPTVVAFFGRDLAHQLVDEGKRASLIIGNNVLAQVPDLNDFVAGVPILLGDDGTATFEFPHLLRLIDGLQYDTIYHEHFSYFSFGTIGEIMRAHGLEITTSRSYGRTEGRCGSTRSTRAARTRSARRSPSSSGEEEEGLRSAERYAQFAEDVKESKRALLDLLIDLRREGRQIVGYGAPGKGNTLLNYCGIRTDLLDYTVDRNPYKHGLFTPGTHIPIFPPEKIAETKPDYILVLPWNLIDEISSQLAFVAEWGGRLIVPIPSATIRDV